MQGDDLGIFGILWGTAVTFALAAVTMVDSGRKKTLILLWSAGVVFLVAALGWPFISERWPDARAFVQLHGGSQLWFNAIGLTIFGLLVWDFWNRRRWLISHPNASSLVLQDLLGRVTHIEKLPPATTAQQTDAQIARDVLLLFHFVIYQSTVLMLDHLLELAPGDMIEGPLQIGGDFENKNAAALEFVDLVRRKLDPGTWRRQNFESAMHDAQNRAEYDLEKTPMTERPSGVDLLALRKWVIAHAQCVRAINFLEHQRREAKEQLRNQRFELLRRYTEKNPS